MLGREKRIKKDLLLTFPSLREQTLEEEKTTLQQRNRISFPAVCQAVFSIRLSMQPIVQAYAISSARL